MANQPDTLQKNKEILSWLTQNPRTGHHLVVEHDSESTTLRFDVGVSVVACSHPPQLSKKEGFMVTVSMVQMIYHLIICYMAMENPIFQFGKASVSIRAIEKPWRTVSHNQRVKKRGAESTDAHLAVFLPRGHCHDFCMANGPFIEGSIIANLICMANGPFQSYQYHYYNRFYQINTIFISYLSHSKRMSLLQEPSLCFRGAWE